VEAYPYFSICLHGVHSNNFTITLGKGRIRCVVSRRLFPFQDNINATRSQKLITQLIHCCVKLRDCGPPHEEKKFSNCIVSKNLRPSRYPQLSTPNFFLWSYLKLMRTQTPHHTGPRPSTLPPAKTQSTERCTSTLRRVSENITEMKNVLQHVKI
jgi:hypothetical protein